MSWSTRRKLLYGGVAATLVSAVLLWVSASLILKPATCFDTVQNQGETGVDCGGPCALFCSNETRAPLVLWSRSFSEGPGVYTAAAYIQNPNSNSNAGAYGVHYAFRLFDSNNLLIAERDGVVDLPPQQTIALVEPTIEVGNRVVARTFLEFSGVVSWTKIPASALPNVRVADQQLSSDGSQLSARVQNFGARALSGLTVVAVLFDASSTAQEASRSTIPLIAPGGFQTAVFTWPGGVPDVVHAEMNILPSLSGQ